MTGTALLSVRDLTVVYRSGGALGLGGSTFTAVRDVSFDIGQGEAFALVGESGSGKTTIGRAILGLAPVASGSVVFDRQNINRHGRSLPLSYRRDVQVVFQDPRSSLNPLRTVREAIGKIVARHFNTPQSETDDRVAAALSRVGMPTFYMDRYPGELSGGQRQRIAIARALATGPRLLICDEPVSALDVSTQSQILNLFAELRRELGLAYLFISHDLAVVRQVADTVGVLRHGQLVETGNCDDIYKAARHPYTRLLLSSVPNPDPDPEGRAERRATRRALRAAGANDA